jgi:hypothetical protein
MNRLIGKLLVVAMMAILASCQPAAESFLPEYKVIDILI